MRLGWDELGLGHCVVKIGVRFSFLMGGVNIGRYDVAAESRAFGVMQHVGFKRLGLWMMAWGPSNNNKYSTD